MKRPADISGTVRKRRQHLPARLLCRVMRAGWGPVPPQPPSRLTRVFYPPLEVNERLELVSIGQDGTVAAIEWIDDEPV